MDDYKDYETCKKEYNEYIKLLEDNIPIKNDEKIEDYWKRFGKTIKNKITSERMMAFLEEKALFINECTGDAIGPELSGIVKLGGEVVISGGFKIINQLIKGEKIDWFDIFIGSVENLINSTIEMNKTVEKITNASTYLFHKLAEKITDYSKSSTIGQKVIDKIDTYIGKGI